MRDSVERRASDDAFQVGRDYLQAGGGGCLVNGVERLARVADFVQRPRLQQAAHVRHDRLGRRADNQRVARAQDAVVDDDAERLAEPALLLDLEHRAFGYASLQRQPPLEIALRQPHQQHEQLGDALAAVADRRGHQRNRLLEILDLGVERRVEIVPAQLAHDSPDALLQRVLRQLRLLLPVGGESALTSAPAGESVNLVQNQDKGRLRPPQHLQRLDSLRLEPLHDVDDQHRQVRQLPPARAQGTEGVVARGIDEEQSGEPDVLLRQQRAANFLDGLERHLGRADVLRDGACLAAYDRGAAYPVKQRRLAVVDVTQHRHNRLAQRSRRGLFLVRGVGVRRLVVAGHQDRPHGGR